MGRAPLGTLGACHLHQGAILAAHRVLRTMLKSRLHLASIATLAAICLTVILPATVAWGASSAAKSKVSPQLSKKVQESINNPATKAQISKEVQEELAKQEAQKAAGSTAEGTDGSSVASGESLTELANKSQQEEGTTSTSTTSALSASPSSASTSTVLVIGGLVAAAVLIAIAFFIFRDARGVAPVSDGLPGGSSRTSATRMRKRRAKAKAAKRQRKRNR